MTSLDVGQLPRHLAFVSADTITASPAPTPAVLTVEVEGGSASFARADAEVELLWALPHAGFSVTVDDAMTVVFRSDDHESVIAVKADDATILHETTEQPGS